VHDKSLDPPNKYYTIIFIFSKFW